MISVLYAWKTSLTGTWSSVAMLFLCCADFSIASLRDLAYCTIALSWESVSTHRRSSKIRISLEATTLQSLIWIAQKSCYKQAICRWRFAKSFQECNMTPNSQEHLSDLKQTNKPNTGFCSLRSICIFVQWELSRPITFAQHTKIPFVLKKLHTGCHFGWNKHQLFNEALLLALQPVRPHRGVIVHSGQADVA